VPSTDLTDSDLAWLAENLRDNLADGWAKGYDDVMTSIGYVALYPDGEVRAYGQHITYVEPISMEE